eukprot:301794-Alexandrium_andersonii.AAC.2
MFEPPKAAQTGFNPRPLPKAVVHFRRRTYGTTRRLTPDEPVIAWIRKVATVIKDGADEDEVAAWREAALQTGFEYVRMEAESDMYFKAKHFRESVVQDFSSLRHTTLQSICDV